MKLVARTVAGSLGAFTLVNSFAAGGGFDANVWWIDVRPLGPAGVPLLALAAVLLVAWAAQPRMSPWRYRLTLGATLVLAGIAWVNTCVVLAMMWRGVIGAGVPVPVTALVTLGLVGLARAMHRNGRMESPPAGRPPRSPARRAAAAVTIAAILALGFPLTQMVLYGKTDYRAMVERPGKAGGPSQADAIVVFGARAYADGRCSDALADRVRTAARLYEQGLAPRVIMSGGPGDGDVHETEAMRRYAVDLGVPPDAILVDERGLNTAATVANTAEMFDTLGVQRALAVSHFYHLPRIKLTYRRAGCHVLTVPAAERYAKSALPYFMAREVAAWWLYWAKAVAA